MRFPVTEYFQAKIARAAYEPGRFNPVSSNALRTGVGALAGAGVGAIGGALSDPEHRMRNALIGAGIGGVGGAAAGHFMPDSWAAGPELAARRLMQRQGVMDLPPVDMGGQTQLVAPGGQSPADFR